MSSNFVHLHNHTQFSLLDGLSKIPELAEKAAEYKMPAVAITDHGAMYGVVEFFKVMKEAGIKPIIGEEFYVAPRSRYKKQPKIDERVKHLVLLAKNEEGYKNLVKLTTKAHLEGFYYKPRIDYKLLKKHSSGLIALSACLKGAIPSAAIYDNKKKAEKLVKKHIEIFGKENFYLELQDHPTLPKQKIANEGLKKLAKRFGIGLVATNDTHYINPDDNEAQEILLCLQTKNTLLDENRKLSMKDIDASFTSPEKIKKAFSDTPEAIDNTLKIAEKCNFELKLGETILPHFEPPKGKTVEKYLEELCHKGLKQKFGKNVDKKVLKQLEYELKMIKKTGLINYLLIVADFAKQAFENNILARARGSAAGSLVTYLLNISDVDPLEYGLIFERFINPERISMPDVDLDVQDDRRDELFEYARGKYGKDSVAQIITFGTMASRAAIRDVGRVLGYPYVYCDKIAKTIPMAAKLDDALKSVSELKQTYDEDPQAKRLIDTAKRLEGVARHASVHACGIVITKDSMDTYTPRQHASRDDFTIVTQYEMHAIEDLGLLKMDFLGLKNLTILKDALKIIEKTKGKKIDIHNLPLDDKKTFKLFQNAETTGVFQLESSGMKRYIKELKPTKISDIIAMVSLYRPGPMEWIPKFIDGKHGRIKIDYIHPSLKPVLEETYGVIVYQEQVMQIARILAGFTMGEADVLRKAIGKKIKELLKEQKKKFIEGCVKNAHSKEFAEKVFNYFEPFARYGFNKSHATAYAITAFQTAYLKAHFPAEFMAALLTSDQENTDRVAIEISECQQMGIEVLPPSVNDSFPNFTVISDKTIRFGLAAIKNVGHNLIDAIIKEKKENGKFKNLDDFASRIFHKDFNKKSLESLIKSGAMDEFGERNQMLVSVDTILKYSRSRQKARENGQKDIFSLMSTGKNTEDLAPQITLQKAEFASQKEKLAWEKELLGLYVSEHPMKEFQKILEGKVTSCSNLSIDLANQKVRIAGVVSKIKKIITKNNDPMLFVTIEDTSGNVEVLVFPKLLEKTTDIWEEDQKVIIEGRVSDKDGIPKILLDSAKPLNKKTILETKNNPLSQRSTPTPAYQPIYHPHQPTYQNYLSNNYQNQNIENQIKINLPQKVNRDLLTDLKKILVKSPGNKKVVLKMPEGKEIETSLRIEPTDELKKEIGKLNIKI